jgi:hypothetical protein
LPGLNLRAGARLPNGFLVPTNFEKVLLGLPLKGLSDGFENDFFPANPPGLPLLLPPNPPGFPEGLPPNFRFAKSPAGLRASPPSARAGRSEE